jgi:hypothetical protein
MLEEKGGSQFKVCVCMCINIYVFPPKTLINMAGEMAQVVECLVSKYEALSSLADPPKKNLISDYC